MSTSVIMLCKAYPPVTGGVETFSEQVARAYLSRGLNVTVITQTIGVSGWQYREYPEGRVPLYNTGSGGQLLTALRMLRALASLRNPDSHDFVHATTWRPAMVVLPLRLTKPLVVTVHGREIMIVPEVLKPLMRAIFRKAAVVVSVSSATQSRATERLGKTVNTTNWLVAGNGLSYPSSEQRMKDRTGAAVHPSQRVHFLTLARLVERKNIQACIEAFRSLRDAGYEFEYKIAGSGPLAEILQQYAREANLDGYVHFLGYVPDSEIPALYQWADIFLHPQIDLNDSSDFEGFGLSIADAMSFGCLAIAGRGSGPSDFIEDRITGLLVDGSDQEQLTGVIRSILDNPYTYRGVASAGALHVRNELSWNKHVGSVLSALELS